MNNSQRCLRSDVTAVLLPIFLMFMGCASGKFSTAASMRIEVEVYKGPLSKTLDTQWGELVGIIEESSDALTTYNDSLVMIAANKKLYMTTECGSIICYKGK